MAVVPEIWKAGGDGLVGLDKAGESLGKETIVVAPVKEIKEGETVPTMIKEGNDAGSTAAEITTAFKEALMEFNDLSS